MQLPSGALFLQDSYARLAGTRAHEAGYGCHQARIALRPDNANGYVLEIRTSEKRKPGNGYVPKTLDWRKRKPGSEAEIEIEADVAFRPPTPSLGCRLTADVTRRS